MLLYFSGTGNSRWVADSLAKLLNERVYALLDVAARPSLFDLKAGGALGFVFPVYAWGPPVLVIDILAKLQVEVKPAYVYFVCT